MNTPHNPAPISPTPPKQNGATPLPKHLQEEGGCPLAAHHHAFIARVQPALKRTVIVASATRDLFEWQVDVAKHFNYRLTQFQYLSDESFVGVMEK